MRSSHYRVVGAFELIVRPRDVPGDETLTSIDLEGWQQWAWSLAREVGLDPCGMTAHDGLLRMVVHAVHPEAVLALARWVPDLEARPLHRVEDYFRVLTELCDRSAGDPRAWWSVRASGACGRVPASATA